MCGAYHACKLTTFPFIQRYIDVCTTANQSRGMSPYRVQIDDPPTAAAIVFSCFVKFTTKARPLAFLKHYRGS